MREKKRWRLEALESLFHECLESGSLAYPEAAARAAEIARLALREAARLKPVQEDEAAADEALKLLDVFGKCDRTLPCMATREVLWGAVAQGLLSSSDQARRKKYGERLFSSYHSIDHEKAAAKAVEDLLKSLDDSAFVYLPSVVRTLRDYRGCPDPASRAYAPFLHFVARHGRRAHRLELFGAD